MFMTCYEQCPKISKKIPNNTLRSRRRRARKKLQRMKREAWQKFRERASDGALFVPETRDIMRDIFIELLGK